MNVRQAIAYGAKELERHACAGADAVRDAELLLAFAIGATKEDLATTPERALFLREGVRYRRLIARRKAHAPMAYLTGWAWFHGRRFRVTKATLIPRPATETIVDAALRAAERAAVIADVGTGSGCVAVTCALERPMTPVFATDLSRGALRIARRNAGAHGVADRIAFAHDDLLDRTRARLRTTGRVVIIANLPYLPRRMRDELAPDVLDNEPALALFGGADGLEPSRKLMDQIAAWPGRPPLDLFLELLSDQVETFIRYAENKIPGLSAEPILNAADLRIGARVTVR